MATLRLGQNTHGKNVFREVRVKCQVCKGTKTSFMQCDTGLYEWDCGICGDVTEHRVTEVSPIIRGGGK